MSFLNLSTTNSDLGWVIRKNPNVGLQAKAILDGTLFGWYDTPTSYNIYYRANPVKDGRDGYLQPDAYVSLQPLLLFLTDWLQSALKDANPKDIPCQHTITLACVRLKSLPLAKNFDVHFRPQGFALNVVSLQGKLVQLTIQAENQTLKATLQYLFLFAAASLLREKDAIELQDAWIEKVLRIVEELQAPFFIRYLLKGPLLGRGELFRKYKTLLEGNGELPIYLTPHDSAFSRFTWCAEQLRLQGTETILDIGCGEGFYVSRFSERVQTYMAVDRDAGVLESAKNKGASNTLFFPDTNAAFLALQEKGGPAVVLLMEVIEHSSVEESQELLGQLAVHPLVHRILITTPNKNFNVHFHLGDEMRHDDHKFEFTPSEFRDFILAIFPAHGWRASFSMIGDRVGDDGISQGVELVRV